MATTVNVLRDWLDEHMAWTGAPTGSEAVAIAIDAYVRRAKRERLLASAGNVDIHSNELVEALDGRD